MPANACRAAAARTASTATCTLPSVRFLKPTGIDSPEPSWRWIWLSVVRAPIAPHETASAMYCGVIGSRNSQPTGRPTSSTPSSTRRARCSPALTSPDPSRCGSLIKPLPADRRAGLLEVHPHRYHQLAAHGARESREPPRVVERGVGVVDAARPDDREQPIIDSLEDRVDVVASAQRRRPPATAPSGSSSSSVSGASSGTTRSIRLSRT